MRSILLPFLALSVITDLTAGPDIITVGATFVDEAALPTGVRVMAQLAVDYLSRGR